MGKKMRPFFAAYSDVEHKELFELRGNDRYDAIQNLPAFVPDLMCVFYKHCNVCPLALRFPNGHGYCAGDETDEDKIRFAIYKGAEFLTYEEALKNAEKN